jgi:hypothetical protein
MSIENLLFFLLLLALPLIERLMRAMRARASGPPGDDLPARNGATVPRPRAPASIPQTGTAAAERRGPELPLPASPLPAALHTALQPAASEHLPASERAPRRERKPVPATSRRTGQSERPFEPRRIAPGDLRRAIVLMTVLGPCRALEQKDASQLG